MIAKAYNSNNYRYGYSGKEKDDELKGSGNSIDFGARVYDTRIGRFFSIDPLSDDFPNQSSYQYAFNSPIVFIDIEGKSPISVFIKQAVKFGVKKAAKEFVEAQVKSRVRQYVGKKLLSKTIAKQLAKDADDILSALDSEWWEYALELVPIVGDAYGASSLGIKTKKLWDRLNQLERFTTLYTKAGDLAFKAVKRFDNLKGKGADFLNDIADRANNLGKSLDADHLTAYISDLRGKPIVNEVTGKIYDHIDDVENHMNGLNSAIKELKNKINHSEMILSKKNATTKEMDSVLSGDVLKNAKELLGNLEGQRNSIRQLINEAKQEVKNAVN